MHPWWSFNGIKHRIGRFRFLILLVILLVGCIYLGFITGAQIDKWQNDKISGQETRLDTLYTELDQKIRHINYLTVELEVEQKANAQIQQELLELRQESFELRRELNFYQKVLAPELVADGISVEQFKVEPTNIPDRVKFRFALVQTNTEKRYAKGYIRLTLNGIEGEESRSFDLAKLANLDKAALKFSFHYFQYFEGEFDLPENVLVEEIAVKVIQPKTKWQSYKSFVESLPWPQLSDEDDEL